VLLNATLLEKPSSRVHHECVPTSPYKYSPIATFPRTPINPSSFNYVYHYHLKPLLPRLPPRHQSNRPAPTILLPTCLATHHGLMRVPNSPLRLSHSLGYHPGQSGLPHTPNISCNVWTGYLRCYEEKQWLATIHTALMECCREIIEGSRSTISVSTLCYYRSDSLFRMPDLDKFIDCLEHQSQDCNSTNTPKPRDPLPHFDPTNLNREAGNLSQDKIGFYLASIEEWADFNESGWLRDHLQSPDTCQRIKEVSRHYYDRAKTYYLDDPEGRSIMVLTILDMFVASDQAACAVTPLLLDFDPGVPATAFENLLLHRRGQLVRLQKAEAYLDKRRTSMPGSDTIPFLAPFGKQNSFAVQYATASDHQHHYDGILHKIRADYEQSAELKLKEFKENDHAYAPLDACYHEVSCVCTYGSRNGYGRGDSYGSQRNPGCERCNLRDRMDKFTIDVLENPLPPDRLEQLNIAFELDPPPSILAYRDHLLFEKRSWDMLKSNITRRNSIIRCRVMIPLYATSTDLESTRTNVSYYFGTSDLTRSRNIAPASTGPAFRSMSCLSSTVPVSNT
jgi:hypothetical protein